MELTKSEDRVARMLLQRDASHAYGGTIRAFAYCRLDGVRHEINIPLLMKLQKRGIVQRTMDTQKRLVTYALTEAAREELEDAYA